MSLTDQINTYKYGDSLTYDDLYDAHKYMYNKKIQSTYTKEKFEAEFLYGIPVEEVQTLLKEHYPEMTL